MLTGIQAKRNLVIVVCPNPCVEVTLFVSRIQQGLNEEIQAIREPGGKGTNVSRILHTLRVPVVLLGFIGGYRGRYICKSLTNEAVKFRLLNHISETRCSYVIIDKNSKQTMIFRERGQPVTKHGKKRLLSILNKYLRRSSLLCLSGSLPPGLPPTFYAEICAAARKLRVRTLVDCSGATLLETLRARPYLIKPNLDEAEEVLGKRLKSDVARVDAMYKLQSLGAQNVLLSLGARGALALLEGVVYRVRVPTVPVLNPVGAGDALLAGLIWSFDQVTSWKQRLQHSCAVAVASTRMPSSGRIAVSGLKRYISQVRVSSQLQRGRWSG